MAVFFVMSWAIKNNVIDNKVSPMVSDSIPFGVYDWNRTVDVN